MYGGILELRKMIKCTISITIVLALVLCFSASISYAIPDSESRQITLGFLERVAGLDMNKYTVVSFEASRSKMPDALHYQTNMRIVISDNENKFEGLVTLVDGEVWTYSLNSLLTENTVSDLSLGDYLTGAKRAVEQYQTSFNADYCNEFLEMVSKASQNPSTMVETEKALLKIEYIENSLAPSERIQICWLPKINSKYTSPFKSVSVSMSKKGLLTRLTDNMRLYHFVTTDIKLSKEEATSLAMPYIEAYAHMHQQGIKSLETTIDFLPDISSNRGDRFEVYPRWEVAATFDKTNEEKVFGYSVLIWADNGKVYHHGSQGSYSQTEANDGAYSLWWLASAILVFAVLSSVGVYTQHRTRTRRRKK